MTAIRHTTEIDLDIYSVLFERINYDPMEIALMLILFRNEL